MIPSLSVNILRTKQNDRHFLDDIFYCISLNENILYSIIISLPVPNIPGDKLLSEPMMAILPTHICVTRPQTVQKMVVLVQF